MTETFKLTHQTADVLIGVALLEVVAPEVLVRDASLESRSRFRGCGVKLTPLGGGDAARLISRALDPDKLGLPLSLGLPSDIVRGAQSV